MQYHKVWALIDSSEQWHIPLEKEVILGWVCETTFGYDPEGSDNHPLALVPSF